MSDPVTTLNTATEVVNSFSALLAATLATLPTIGYAITVIAAFLPPPPTDQGWYFWLHWAVNKIAINVKHAKNANTETTQ